jgi:multidrug efflux pump subunit AcrA (membrane-fusion protein)
MRKEKIKNIAIIFLALMLILTLFSNTIMNRSLVEVSTQQIYSDSLTSKVRGSGTVEASENYSVIINETRKIATVEVRTGAEVEAGDVLFTLTDAESEELVSKRAELAQAEADYETAVINSGITVAQREAIESGTVPSLSERQNSLVAAQNAVDSAQATVDTLTAQVDAVKDVTVDTSAEDLALLNAQQSASNATYTKDQKQTAYDNAVSSNDVSGKKAIMDDAQEALNMALSAGEDTTALEAAYNNAKASYDNAVNACASALNELNQAENALAAANKSVTDTQYQLDLKKLSGTGTDNSAQLQSQLTAANTTLKTAQDDLSDLQNLLTSQITLSTSYSQLQTLQDAVAELEENATDGQITSPIAGTVTEILYTAGQTVQQAETLMTIQPENKAFQLSFTVTADQAKRIKVGDAANVVNNWYGRDITATVYSIKKDSDDRTKNTVTCNLSGDVSVGDSYTLSIGDKSSNYDYVVPTSSIREDSNGKFILILESKSTPLGNRYYARRVSVEVLASDDTNSAVSGAIEDYSYVITTTAKPVEENQQVRLAD